MRRAVLRIGCAPLVASALCLAASGASAADPPDTAGLTPSEFWVEQQIASGLPADLRNNPACTPPQSTVVASDDAPCRDIGGRFVERLLAGGILPSASWPHAGITISHAVVTDDLDLTGVAAPRRLSLLSTRFRGDVVFEDARFEQSVLLQQDCFDRSLLADGLQVGGDLRLDGSRVAHGIRLVGARVAGFLSARAIGFGGRADLANAVIGQSLSLAGVPATACTPPAEAALPAPGGIDLDQTRIGANLLVEGDDRAIAPTSPGARLHDEPTRPPAAISAVGSEIKGHVGIAARITGRLDLSHAQVQDYVTLHGSHIVGDFAAAGIHVAHRVDLSDTVIAGTVDLSNAEIEGPLRLTGVQWQPTETMEHEAILLEGAHVERLADAQGSWPPRHRIDGFVFHSLDGAAASIFGRWRRTWLQSDEGERDGFDPQPFQQLETVMQAYGDRTHASEVAFWEKQAERADACRSVGSSCIGLTLLFLFVGYGIGIYAFVAVLSWVALFTIVSALVLRPATSGDQKRLAWRCLAGLDRLLPIIHLSPEFEEFFLNKSSQLNMWRVGYFAFVAIFGWFLGLVLAASLSGLTQGS